MNLSHRHQKESTRAPKPKLEDFTEYSEEAKTVHTDDFKQALSDWTEQNGNILVTLNIFLKSPSTR